MRDPCPDTERLAAYLEKRLPAEEIARLESHFLSCQACRQLLARIIKSESVIADPIVPAKPRQ